MGMVWMAWLASKAGPEYGSLRGPPRFCFGLTRLSRFSSYFALHTSCFVYTCLLLTHTCALHCLVFTRYTQCFTEVHTYILDALAAFSKRQMEGGERSMNV